MKQNLFERIQQAIEIIKKLDYETLECGKYHVNDNFFYIVQEYETKDSNMGKFESHKDYVDIQFLIAGHEYIEITSAAFLETDIPYDVGTDINFYKEPKYKGYIELVEKSYAVFYPWDAHKPGIKVKNIQKNKKIVGKIRI